jgi:hypothetical protein
VEWVHGPENPVAEALVVAVMSDGEDLCGASVEGDNVTVGEVAGWESRDCYETLEPAQWI